MRSTRPQARFWLSFLFLVWTLGVRGQNAHAQSTPIPQRPSAKSYVLDLAHLFYGSDHASLNRLLSDYEQRTGHQFFILTLAKLEDDESIDDYSMRVVEAWRIGRPAYDDGLLLTIAQNPRKVRIEVGYGLEGSIPDVLANRVIREILRPNFRNGHFYQGCQSAMETFIAAVDKNPPDPATLHSPSAQGKRAAKRLGKHIDKLARSTYIHVALLLLTPLFLIAFFSRVMPKYDPRRRGNPADPSRRKHPDKKTKHDKANASDVFLWGGVGGALDSSKHGGDGDSGDIDSDGDFGGGGSSGDW